MMMMMIIMITMKMISLLIINFVMLAAHKVLNTY